MDTGVGTIQQPGEQAHKKKSVSGLSRSRGTGGNGRNRGGGGGGNDDDNTSPTDFAEAEQYPPDKFKILMWFTLLVVLMTFSGLIAAYIVISTNSVAEWKPFNLPLPVWISTGLIIASSITYEIFRKNLNSDRQAQAKNWLMITCTLGSMFISSQLFAWMQLVRMGIYVQSNQYAGFFYIITAVHAIHVIGGISGLIYLLSQVWNQTTSQVLIARRRATTTSIGWYWHFMGVLWVILFILLGFWK